MSSDLARGIFCSTISSQTEHDICTSDAHCFRFGSLRRSREKLPNRRIHCHSLFNAAMRPSVTGEDREAWLTTFPPQCATVVTNFTKRVIFFFFCYCVGPHYRTLPHNRRILTATMYGHFAVYESLNSCTRAHFCCGLLEVGSPISAFRFSPSHILKIRRHLVIFHAIIINNIVNTGYGA